MNQLKKMIEEKLISMQTESVEFLLAAYEKTCPADLELYSMKVMYYLAAGDIDKAYETAKAGARKNPYNAEAIYNLGVLSEKKQLYFEAYQNYVIAFLLADFFEEENILAIDFAVLLDGLHKKMEDIIKDLSAGEAKKYHERIEWLKNRSLSGFGLIDRSFWGEEPVIGSFYEHRFGDKRFVAQYHTSSINSVVEHNYNDTVYLKAELLKAGKQSGYEVTGDTDVLLPIAAAAAGTRYTFECAGQSYTTAVRVKHHFNYYRVSPGTHVHADKEAYFGEPVRVCQDTGKKKLVLNIFLDGFSQLLIDEEGLENLMPKTARFFSKGIICNNAYSASEWTYPSIASYMTGLDTTGHMLVHNKMTASLPEDVTLLSEYFKEQGFATAKIDGDWRSTAAIGYARGVDRILFQHQWSGMRMENVVFDTLEHLELMEETNQFVWMCIGDLHDIADGLEVEASVQKDIPLSFRTEDAVGQTSAKQKYSENKRYAYMKKMKKVDLGLNILYQYIEEHYTDDEIIVSLFGDHGQGYLVKPNQHFLSPGRTKVGMMFRGGFDQGGACEELISACDYGSIMCKLAGIKMKNENIAGRLPGFFGGSNEREYVLSESIHMKDPYMAALFTKDSAFYLTSEGLVGDDGRFKMGRYTTRLERYNGEEIFDASLAEKYTNIVLEHIAGNLIYE